MTRLKAKFIVLMAMHYGLKPWDVDRLILPEFDAFLTDAEYLVKNGGAGDG